MNRDQLRQMLEDVRAGRVEVDRAVDRVAFAPFDDVGFAKLDTHRELRCGFPEVLYGPGKTPEQLVALFERAARNESGCLATRIDDAQAKILFEKLIDIEVDLVGRTAWRPAPKHADIPMSPSGTVAVVTAGTGDLPVAQEAATTARVMGATVDLIVDVGVAGLHRLLAQRERLTKADVLIVVAGMEGALPSVVGGLVDRPVIAVPTSVGYGASLQGVAALLGMLSSCAPNVVVVNIDAGFKAGYAAALMVREKPPRP